MALRDDATSQPGAAHYHHSSKFLTFLLCASANWQGKSALDTPVMCSSSEIRLLNPTPGATALPQSSFARTEPESH